ncbi:DUF2550 family protein [Cellulomonas pakistanensis]|uniref:DUF2550 family protein n=1 Tax=Cellulomonas pakistanensis TaxID=992287 RepID=UPI0019441D2C|nr:DUF2550 family protein [Cellulomonas pakistanensis]
MTPLRTTVLVALLAGVLGALAAAAVGRWVLHEEDLTSAWLIGAGTAIGVGVGTPLARALDTRRTAAGARRGRFEVSVRSTGGDPGVGPRWVAGRLDLDEDRVMLVRFALGMRPPPRPAVRLALTGVRRAGRRTPRSGLRVLPGLEVVELAGSRGTVEVAVEPASADRLVERLSVLADRGATA